MRVGALVGPGGPRNLGCGGMGRSVQWGHPVLPPGRDRPCGEQDISPSPPRGISAASACHRPPGGDLPNPRFLNKAPHAGRALRVCAALEPGVWGRQWHSRGLHLS